VTTSPPRPQAAAEQRAAAKTRKKENQAKSAVVQKVRAPLARVRVGAGRRGAGVGANDRSPAASRARPEPNARRTCKRQPAPAAPPNAPAGHQLCDRQEADEEQEAAQAAQDGRHQLGGRPLEVAAGRAAACGGGRRAAGGPPAPRPWNTGRGGVAARRNASCEAHTGARGWRGAAGGGRRDGGGTPVRQCAARHIARPPPGLPRRTAPMGGARGLTGHSTSPSGPIPAPFKPSGGDGGPPRGPPAVRGLLPGSAASHTPAHRSRSNTQLPVAALWAPGRAAVPAIRPRGPQRRVCGAAAGPRGHWRLPGSG
jgi:hypothetical protein